MMSAKLATLELLKIKVCKNKGYNAVISAHDVIKKFYQVKQIIM